MDEAPSEKVDEQFAAALADEMLRSSEPWWRRAIHRDSDVAALRSAVDAWNRDEVLPEIAGATAARIAAHTSGAKWRERIAALTVLGFVRSADPSEIDSLLLRVLADNSVGRDASHRVQRWLGRTVGLAAMAFIASIMGKSLPFEGRIGSPLPPLFEITVWLLLVSGLAIIPVLVWSIQAENRRIASVRAAAAATLGQRKSGRALDLLTATSLESNRAVARSSRSALMRILPLLSENDYGRVSAESVRNLCRLLRPLLMSEPRNALAVLDALGAVGGVSAVETVQYLAETSDDAVIRVRAVAILPVLLERQRKERDSSRLLRPSESRSEDGLLRAVTSTTDTPELLVRAHAGPDT